MDNGVFAGNAGTEKWSNQAGGVLGQKMINRMGQIGSRVFTMINP